MDIQHIVQRGFVVITVLVSLLLAVLFAAIQTGLI
jgi:Tfp pilus assembly protein PilX